MESATLQTLGVAIGAGGGLLTQVLSVGAFLAALFIAAAGLDAGDGLDDAGGLFGIAGLFFVLGTLSLTWFATRPVSGTADAAIEWVLFIGFAVALLLEAIAALGCIGLAVHFLAKGKLWHFGGSMAGLASLLVIGGAQFFLGLYVLT